MRAGGDGTRIRQYTPRARIEDAKGFTAGVSGAFPPFRRGLNQPGGRGTQ